MNNKILVIALGNDILSDDGVAIEALNYLKEEYSEKIELEEVFGGGLELLDLMEGKEKVLIIDSIYTGQAEPGTIYELNEDNFSKTITSSPHYVGLPEVLNMAKLLEIPFPNEIKILAMEIKNINEVKQGLSKEVQDKLPSLVFIAKEIIEKWI